MNLNRTLMATAVGALFAAGAAPVLASSIAVTQGIGAANTIYMSGSTAQDGIILQAMRDKCTGQLDVFNYSGTNKQELFSCSAYPGITGDILVYKDSAIGSGNGIYPYLSPSDPNFAKIQFASTAGLNTTACSSTAVSAGTAGPAYTNWACTGNPTLNSAIVPDIGFADVEPAVFGFTTLPGSTGAISVNQLVFGIQVSTKLYHALQSVQGTTGRPSLSSSQVAAILSGYADITTLGITPGSADDTLYIARRGNDSGTEKTSEIIFLQQNAITPPPVAILNPANPLTGVAQFGAATDLNAPVGTAAPTAGYTTLVQYCGNGTTAPTGYGGGSLAPVFGGSGSGDVSNCMTYHGNYRYAIGIQGLTVNDAGAFTNTTNANYPTTASAGTGGAAGTGGQYWRYVKLDGNAPTVANVIAGKYQDSVEGSEQPKTGLSGNQAAFQASLTTALSDSTTLAQLNAGFTTFGEEPAGGQLSGALGLPPILVGGSCPAGFGGGVTADSDPTGIATKSQLGFPNSFTKPGVQVCPSR